MKNKVQEGNTISLASETYPGKNSGDLVAIGKSFGVAAVNNPAITGQLFEAETTGVFDLPKLAEGITQGSRLYWNGAGLTATPTGLAPVGTAWETVPTGDTLINCKINQALPSGSL